MKRTIIKIAFFNKDLPSDKPNGVSCQVHRLANALVNSGHEVTCISYSPRPDDALYNHIKLFYKSRLKLLRKFEPAFGFRRVKTDDFDILHYHGDDYLVRGRKNRIRTFYGSAFSEALSARKAGRFMYQALFYIFELVSCVRKGLKTGISKFTCKHIPFVKKTIPCGVPLDIFIPGDIKTEFPSIFFLGDIDSRKRGRYLLEIFNNRVLKKYPECILTIVGPDIGDDNNIRYLGNISQEKLIAEYQRSWVYCMPSSYEGFGVPAIEAMACGTAVVAVDNPGIKEIIRNNYNGLLSDDSGLFQNIDRVFSDRDFRIKLENNGRNTVKERYDIKIIADEYEKLYKSALL